MVITINNICNLFGNMLMSFVLFSGPSQKAPTEPAHLTCNQQRHPYDLRQKVPSRTHVSPAPTRKRPKTDIQNSQKPCPLPPVKKGRKAKQTTCPVQGKGNASVTVDKLLA